MRAVHFNDSKAAYNSRVDRHWHIGHGHIGGGGARAASPRTRDSRTPRSFWRRPQDETCDDACNLAALRSFVKAPATEKAA